MGDYRIEKTKDGTECWVTADLSVVDRFAPLLASMMPIIRDDQWAIIGPLPAEQQATFVRANLKMWDEERELRLQDKARTVHGPTGFAGGEV